MQIGNEVEKRIEAKQKESEKFEEAKAGVKKLEQEYLQEKDAKARVKLEKKLNQLKEEISNKENDETSVLSYEKIRELTLRITDLMLKAANAEDLGEVMRDQNIMAFKVDPTSARWDTVRSLCSDEEWEKIKQELVGFVMQRDEGITQKIELLMKDGLYGQAISIFPYPSSEAEELDKQMELLTALYKEIDNNDLQHLENILPVVQRYCKRFFQQWKYDRLSDLFDLLQRRFPQVLITIHSTAIDMLLLNILQSQYPLFLNLLKAFKSRVYSDLGMVNEWNAFMDEFKKKYKSKKKLLQMMSIISDSVWDIEAMIAASGGAGVKKEKGKAAATPATKSTTKPASKPFAAFTKTPVNIAIPSVKKEKAAKTADSDDEGAKTDEEMEDADIPADGEEEEEKEADEEEPSSTPPIMDDEEEEDEPKKKAPKRKMEKESKEKKSKEKTPTKEKKPAKKSKK